ncbi:MAG TPA: hypothetical protein VHO29_15000 [Marmoricola sp.]|nr:hypothetical protein [Marmoricola sp.]
MSVLVRDSVVRLTMGDFEGLVAGDLPETEQQQALLVPGMLEALAVVRDPVLALQLDLVVARGGRTHLGWIGVDAVALLLPIDGRIWQLMALPVDRLPSSLARIVGLGPGTGRCRTRRDLRRNPFETFFSADERIRTEALEEHGLDVAWTLGVRSQAEEWLMAAASGPDGPWLFTPSAAGAEAHQSDRDLSMVAEPVSATAMYRRFASIVPGLAGAR